MSYTLIANRYAKALFDLSKQEGQLEEVYKSLEGMSKLLTPSSDFYAFVHNPLLPLETRMTIIKALFAGKVPAVLERFLLYINAKRRFNVLSDIITAFDSLYLNLNNRVRGIIKTAQPWEPEQKQLLRQRLNDKFGKDVLLDWQIDPQLIGGFKVIIGDQLIDFSFKSQLELYREKVLN